MITQINHIGIAVESLDKHIPFYRDVLKLHFEGTEEVADQKVRVAMFKVGQVRIELLEPTSLESPIAKFLEKKGEGMHHIAYQSDDVAGQIADLKKQNIEMIDQEARPRRPWYKNRLFTSQIERQGAYGNLPSLRRNP
jgi:methylmalonyl-CoA/ethylmalonyl-CoA epimerase